MHIGIAYYSVLAHITFALGGFFCEDVTFESFLEGDLTRTGDLKALLGAAIGFNLWHFITYYRYSLLASQNYGNLLGLVGNV